MGNGVGSDFLALQVLDSNVVGPQLVLDWMTINGVDVNGVWYTLAKEKGWYAGPSNRSTYDLKINRHGALRTPGFLKSRNIELEITVSAPNLPAMYTAMH